MSLAIREATTDDIPAIADLWEAAEFLGWWRDPRADAARLLDRDNATVFVGELDSGVMAVVAAGDDGRRGWLMDLMVHANHRGRGYGLQMARAAEVWLAERGLDRAQILLRTDDRAAMMFCRALGYDVSPRGVMARWLGRPPLPRTGAGEPGDDGKLDIAITFLEQTERPAQPTPHPPPGQRAALMRAEHPTVSFYRYLYNTVGAPWLWWERRALDDAALARIVQDERVEVYVLYVDGVPAGFAELDRREKGLVNLAFFGLIPEFRRRGLGSFLLRSVLDIAWSQEPRKVIVNTCTLDDPRVLPMYQRLGFTPVRREQRRIDDPRLTGLIPVV
jgi:GNAT superfamily N-acetyltransferase